MIDFSALSAPFPPNAVSWRVGATSPDKSSGLALAYIDARDVMERLDSVCGPDGWQCKYSHAGAKTVCDIGIRTRVISPSLSDEAYQEIWIWKANGAGDTDVEQEKGALSDAFKRAAVVWGIGRYLYSLDSPWVGIEAAGRSFKIRPSEKPKLIAALERLAKGLPSPPDIAAEAREIHAQQNAERKTAGLKPLRKPNPTRREWANYAIEDIKELDTQGIADWDRDNAAKLEQLEEQNHSLWKEITDTIANRLDALRAPV